MTEPIQLPSVRRRARDTAEQAAEFHRATRKRINDRFDGKIDTANSALELAAEAYDRVQADQNDREPLYWRPPFSWLYWFFLAALAVAEVPVNRLSFQLFFNESPTVVMAVAALIGTILIMFAHWAGMIMRRFRYSCREKGGALASLGRLTGVSALILVLCHGVAIFRQAYLAFATQPDPSFAAAIENDQFGEAALIALQSSLSIDGTIFMLINLAIVGVGVLFAFYRHDPHPNFEELDRGRLSAMRDLKRLQEQRDWELDRERRRYLLECQRKEFTPCV